MYFTVIINKDKVCIMLRINLTMYWPSCQFH